MAKNVGVKVWLNQKKKYLSQLFDFDSKIKRWLATSFTIVNFVYIKSNCKYQQSIFRRKKINKLI